MGFIVPRDERDSLLDLAKTCMYYDGMNELSCMLDLDDSSTYLEYLEKTSMAFMHGKDEKEALMTCLNNLGLCDDSSKMNLAMVRWAAAAGV